MGILIAVCTNRGLQPQTLQCLMNLEGEFDVIVPTEGYTIAENRNWASYRAVNGKYDYLLFIDDDMVFNADLLANIKGNNKDICGVAFHPRTDDMETKAEVHHENLKDKKLFKTDAVGTGIMLIKTKIMKDIPRPWFAFETHENGCTKTGEDWVFCNQATRAGFEVWCDPTIYVKHLGEIIYEKV